MFNSPALHFCKCVSYHVSIYNIIIQLCLTFSDWTASYYLSASTTLLMTAISLHMQKKYIGQIKKKKPTQFNVYSPEITLEW